MTALKILAYLFLLALVLAVVMYAFGWRPTVGVLS